MFALDDKYFILQTIIGQRRQKGGFLFQEIMEAIASLTWIHTMKTAWLVSSECEATFIF